MKQDLLKNAMVLWENDLITTIDLENIKYIIFMKILVYYARIYAMVKKNISRNNYIIP